MTFHVTIIVLEWIADKLSYTNRIFLVLFQFLIIPLTPKIAQLAVAVEYTNCISTEGQDPHPHNNCPGYNSKPHEEILENSFIVITPSSTLVE